VAGLVANMGQLSSSIESELKGHYLPTDSRWNDCDLALRGPAQELCVRPCVGVRWKL
jgi:hypothetical protein